MREFTEQELVRRQKIEEIKKICNPYPEKYDINYTLKAASLLADETNNIRIAGRIIFMRKMGKLSFLKIRDIEGEIQVSIKIDLVGEEKYSFFKNNIDVGDFIGVSGCIFTTQTGEKTLRAENFEFLGKALRPLPEKFHGLQDIELKYRQRYVDLITNEESRKVFLGRSKMYAFIHKYLGEHGFLQVETPILQTAVSGASAKPFYTHHNALDLDCNLRIAPECYLKECIAGGFNRVYELAKCFRNEGMDPQHIQEFTQVEWYVAYWNFEDTLAFYKNFIRNMFREIIGTDKITYQGIELDFSKEKWPRINYVERLTEILGFDFLSITDVEELKAKIVLKKLYTYEELKEYKSLNQVIDFTYKNLIRKQIVEPTIIYNYPTVMMPLTRRNDNDIRTVDMFQVVAVGSELCKAYSELVNPMQQREAFEAQLRDKELGDDETMDIDEDYILAMEQGMPPISGLGFGIDRLMMLMFNQPSVRDVVLFPMMKPNNGVQDM